MGGMAEQEAWVYDPIYFDATVRRSGNSLVITIPPELARRMLISEDQPVRVVGAVRSGIMLEGALLVHLGFFSCTEKVSVYSLTRLLGMRGFLLLRSWLSASPQQT
jgi:hypothetical protein